MERARWVYSNLIERTLSNGTPRRKRCRVYRCDVLAAYATQCIRGPNNRRFELAGDVSA